MPKIHVGSVWPSSTIWNLWYNEFNDILFPLAKLFLTTQKVNFRTMIIFSSAADGYSLIKQENIIVSTPRRRSLVHKSTGCNINSIVWCVKITHIYLHIQQVMEMKQPKKIFSCRTDELNEFSVHRFVILHLYFSFPQSFHCLPLVSGWLHIWRKSLCSVKLKVSWNILWVRLKQKSILN